MLGAALVRQVKCIIWDLDNTLWDGVLLEDREVTLRPHAAEVVRALDARGVLQSVISRNDAEAAQAKLRQFGLADYFLAPQIGWGAKSTAVGSICGELDLPHDAVGFVDDDDFERDEVRYALPQVRCFAPGDLRYLLDLPELSFARVTEEATGRRVAYQAEARRRAAAEAAGTSADFLATLDMRLSIDIASQEDLERAEELTVRTHQLNTTGRTFSAAELAELIESPDHLLLMASLTDKYGSFGRIGLALVQTTGTTWRLQLLLMSCRVLARGVGSVFLGDIMRRAQRAGVTLLVEFLPNDRNRMMLVTLRFAGFAPVGRRGDVDVLQADLSRISEPPDFVKLDSCV